MSQDIINKDDNRLDVSKNPSPKEEAQDFSNTDDKRKGQDYAHELAVLRQKQGFVGSLIGCSDSALTIAFMLLALGALAMAVCLLFMLKDASTFGPVFEKLVTFEGTVAGYVFGKKTSEHEH